MLTWMLVVMVFSPARDVVLFSGLSEAQCLHMAHEQNMQVQETRYINKLYFCRKEN
jgi:hypothetical protein